LTISEIFFEIVALLLPAFSGMLPFLALSATQGHVIVNRRTSELPVIVSVCQ
jgi:hypothetical protein